MFQGILQEGNAQRHMVADRRSLADSRAHREPDDNFQYVFNHYHKDGHVKLRCGESMSKTIQGLGQGDIDCVF